MLIYKMNSRNGLSHTLMLCFIIQIFVILISTEAKRERIYGCVKPKEPRHGYIVYNDRRKSLTYKCYTNLNFFPSISAFVQKDRVCKRGRWSGKPVECNHVAPRKKLCPALRDPENGRVVVTGQSAGDRGTFFCNAGYHIEGSTTMTCEGGRYWTGSFPICKSHKTIRDVAMNFKEKVVDTLSVSTTQSESGVQARLSPGKNGLDIMLLMDTSNSIGPNSIDIAKQFMCRLVEIFGVSDNKDGGGNGTRFGLMTFSSKTTIVFGYESPEARSKDGVKKMISQITRTGGGTNLNDAIAEVMNAQITHVRPGATRAIFIITDAEVAMQNAASEKDILDITDLAKSIRERGTEIFAIGVGKRVDRGLIQSIASDPYYEHVFYLERFDELESIGNIISEKDLDYEQCGFSGNNAIKAGAAASAKGAFPWTGWLSVYGPSQTSWTCGGALLCDRWFMTAAHCVSTVDSKGTVIPLNNHQMHLTLGDTELFKNDGTEKYPQIFNVTIHDNYTGVIVDDTNIREYDIALLDLGKDNQSRPELQKFLRPLCVPTDEESFDAAKIMVDTMTAFPEKQKGYAAGWGHATDNIKYNNQIFSHLQQIELPATKKKLCKRVIAKLDEEKFFCVGDGLGQAGQACKGDIGGPFMVKMPNKLFSGLGLALQTRNCTQPGEFGIYLNLAHPTINKWITPILNKCNRYRPLTDPNKKDKKPDKKVNFCKAN